MTQRVRGSRRRGYAYTHTHMYVHILMADSSCYTAETNAIVWSKYPYSIYKRPVFALNCKKSAEDFCFCKKGKELKQHSAFFASQMSLCGGSWIPNIECPAQLPPWEPLGASARSCWSCEPCLWASVLCLDVFHVSFSKMYPEEITSGFIALL